MAPTPSPWGPLRVPTALDTSLTAKSGSSRVCNIYINMYLCIFVLIYIYTYTYTYIYTYTTARADGAGYIINGEKWLITGMLYML